MNLYFAPINLYSNYIYRHIILKYGADYAFSELILAKQIDKEKLKHKLKYIKEDLPKTIFQIGVSTKEDIDLCFKELTKNIEDIKEININMDCPQSKMQNEKLCSGILFDIDLMKELCVYLSKVCKEKNIIPSVKIRIGTSKDNIEIDKYLSAIRESNIKKVYIHARTLKYSYENPAIYEPLKNIKNKFNNMEIILNGDIDSYEKYNEIKSNFECDGIMIGRCALSNPLIFSQIKNKIESNRPNLNYENKFDPIHKDPHIIVNGQSTNITKEKKKIILEVIDLAIKENYDVHPTRQNIHYLLKGLSKSKTIITKTNQANTLEEIKLILETNL